MKTVVSREPRSLCFSITGEFITNISREWLWVEQRPYEKVMEFLLSSMCGTDMKESELLNYAHGVLMGKYKFIGETRDDSYGMVEDSTDMFKKYPYGLAEVFEFSELSKAFSNIEKNVGYREKRIEVIDSELDDYGWLSPVGKFYPVPWGEHQGWAWDYIEKHFGYDEYIKFREDSIDLDSKAGDFLLHKGWALIHNTQQLEAEVEVNPAKSLTKKQKDFLYGYFSSRGKNSKAMHIFSL